MEPYLGVGALGKANWRKTAYSSSTEFLEPMDLEQV